MIWCSRKPIKKEIDGVILTITPLSSIQQIEFFEIIDEIQTDAKAICKATEWIFSHCVTDIQGLTDELGNPIKMGDISARDLVHGLHVGYLRAIIDAVIEAGKVDEVIKKN